MTKRKHIERRALRLTAARARGKGTRGESNTTYNTRAARSARRVRGA